MAPKRCHYDVLGLDRGARGGDIKKAYRKMALHWHPVRGERSIAQETATLRALTLCSRTNCLVTGTCTLFTAVIMTLSIFSDLYTHGSGREGREGVHSSGEELMVL